MSWSTSPQRVKLLCGVKLLLLCFPPVIKRCKLRRESCFHYLYGYSDSYCLGVSASLDRDRDLASGWEAAVGAGGLSGAQRRGADPPRGSRQDSVQSPDALIA